MIARMTGTSKDALAIATDDDLKAMRLVALSMILVIANAMLIFKLMLYIILDDFEYSSPIAVGVGLVVFVIDRVIVRRHWVNTGREEAAQH